VTVLSNEGFEACKREQTTSRRDRRPAGGLWQGVNPRTGSVASAIWVNATNEDPQWGQRAREGSGEGHGGASQARSRPRILDLGP
jgi:hypothetical protein